jgi:ABC-2 type transport system ATP-binding protein
MTIFLTTQYLEEADALADRVGIIARGRIVAEGTPADLKRSVGSDVIIAKGQAGDTERIKKVLESVEGVGSIELAADEVLIGAANGAKTISPVAVALSEAGIVVEGLTLRTPTLDDVFLHVTGERMGEESP